MRPLLFRPTPIASLVFFRIAFGLLAFADVMITYIGYHLQMEVFKPEGFRFKYYGFQWAEPFPEPWMTLFFIAMMVLAICIMIGFRYRWATLLFAPGFTYIFLLEKSNYLNHAYLFCWLCLVMIFLPAHRAFSVDVWRKPALHRKMIPLWSMAILPALMGVVYFYGGLAKLNSDWLQAMPLKLWLSYKDDLPMIGSILAMEGTAYFMAYGGVLLDLLVVFFLLNKRTRIWAFAATLFFHLMNHLVFTIGIFPFLSTALTAMYFPPRWPQQLVDRVGQHMGWVGRLQDRWAARLAIASTSVSLWQEKPAYYLPVKVGLILVFGIHLVLPFRHHLYPGNAAWTEEGHRYSWRMMLRSKSGIGYFKVHLPDSTVVDVDPKEWLSNRQRRKMLTHPDMILQFAHHLRDHYHTGGEEVEVYAHVRASLNGRRKQYLIDREVDLAKEKWSFFQHSDWVLPLKTPLFED